MDYNTVATADKFGNIAVVSRCEWGCMFTNYVCANRPGFPLTHQMKWTKIHLVAVQYGIGGSSMEPLKR